jgi:hypothetical protein
MRIRSALLVFGFVSVSTMAALVACGSSGSSGGSQPDSGSDATTGPGEASTSLTANANDTSVYIGQAATVAGSASNSSATFAWTLASAPPASAITTASITGAATATPTITPDVAGDYKLTLTATAGGATATATATVHALVGKAFIAHTFDGGNGTTLGDVLVTNADGTGQAPVVCPTPAAGGIGSFALSYDARGGLDWLEGDAGDPVLVAFPYEDVADSGATTTYLAAGSADSRCGTSPVAKLDLKVDAGTIAPQHARLSSSGQRIAYLRDDGIGLYAATIGFDGSDLRVFGPAFIGADGGPGESGSSATVPPRWIDDTQIAWIEIGNDLSSWSLKIVRDEPGATVNTFMDCNSAFQPASVGFFTIPAQTKIYQFDLLPDGSAIVATQLSTVDAGNFIQILVLHPDATTHQCQFVRSFSGAQSGTARDFSVSPDKKSVAFLGSQSGNDGTFSLYVAPIDGTSPPVAVPGAPNQSTEGQGPRWVAGGHTLVWGQGAITDGGSIATVFAVPATGGVSTPIASSSDSAEAFYSVGNSCNVAFENASPVAGFALLGIFIGLVVRRKRSKK